MQDKYVLFDEYAKDYFILIDTSSILCDNFDQFMTVFSEFLKKYNKQITILTACKQELLKHSHNKDDVELASRAKNALNLLNGKYSYFINFRDSGYEEKNRTFADPQIKAFITVERNYNKVLLISQDMQLSIDVNKLNGDKSAEGNSVIVNKINGIGDLESQIDNYKGFDTVYSDKNEAYVYKVYKKETDNRNANEVDQYNEWTRRAQEEKKLRMEAQRAEDERIARERDERNAREAKEREERIAREREEQNARKYAEYARIARERANQNQHASETAKETKKDSKKNSAKTKTIIGGAIGAAVAGLIHLIGKRKN